MGKHTVALATILSVYQTKTKISYDSIKLIRTLKYIKSLQKTTMRVFRFKQCKYHSQKNRMN